MNEIHLVITNICKVTDTQVEVSLLMNNREHSFFIKMCDADDIKSLDFEDNGQFSNILSLDARKSRCFIDVVFSFYAGKSIIFPIDLGCFI